LAIGKGNSLWRLEVADMSDNRDQDRKKGAVEESAQGNTSMAGQLGHRDQDPLLKDADTDFPEPGESPEHSGEPQTSKRPKTGAA
jgi:hypothetical protein